MVRTLKGTIIKKSPKYGVGKQMGTSIYVHESSEGVLPQDRLNTSKGYLPDGFDYQVVKFNEKTDSFTFISSPDWDESEEPIVGDAILVKPNGETKVIKQKSSPQIYHHKWLFVDENYNGFDTEESKNRSRRWLSIPDVDFTRIGYKSFWDTNVVPLIGEGRSTIKRILREYSDDELSKANKTSRLTKTGGSFGTKAVVPRIVLNHINKDDIILDFGSGKYPLYTIELEEMGYEVYAHEFGSNFNPELHDSDALSRRYDMVYASNVLNVQNSEDMLRRTLTQIISVMKPNGKFIANYPSSPRKSGLNVTQFSDVINDYFNYELVGGTKSIPVLLMTVK